MNLSNQPLARKFLCNLFLVFFCCCGYHALAQSSRYPAVNKAFDQALRAPLTGKSVTRSIKTFGARGDGVTNDSWAFMKAAKYIRELNNHNYTFNLFIPKGTYIVGLQSRRGEPLYFQDLVVKAPGNEAYYGALLMDLTNCKNLRISGEKGTIIKFADSLKFGSFDATTGLKYISPNFPFTNSAYAASAGILFFLNTSKNTEIVNLELNGNMDKLNVGGDWGDYGIQLAHIGVYLYGDVSNIRVRNVHAHHFGLDGFMMKSFDTLNTSFKILDSCRSSYNGRQGFSWTGGNGLMCFHTSFTHTGKGRLRSLPTTGLDIEPEDGGSSCVNGYFERCMFGANYSFGLLATSTKVNKISRGHVFQECSFVGTTAGALKSPGSGSRFVRCSVFGAVVSPTGYQQEACVFEQCHFTDNRVTTHPALRKALKDLVRKPEVIVLPYALIDNSWGKGKTTYNECTFDITGSIGFMMDGGKTNLLRKCQINFNYPASYLNSKNTISYFNDCVMQQNKIRNYCKVSKSLLLYSNGQTETDKQNELINLHSLMYWKTIHSGKPAQFFGWQHTQYPVLLYILMGAGLSLLFRRTRYALSRAHSKRYPLPDNMDINPESPPYPHL